MRIKKKFKAVHALYLCFFMGISVASAYADTSTGKEAPAPVTAETGADGVQRLTIILDSYSFTPSYIVVSAGTAVEFTLKNAAVFAPHNFRIESGGLLLEQDVSAGQSVVVSFTPTTPGVYEFYCSKKPALLSSHRSKGMVGKLEVR